LGAPTATEVDQTITELRATGVHVMITELDVNLLPPLPAGARGQTLSAGTPERRSFVPPELNPYVNGLPDDVQRALAGYYADAFRVFLQHRDDITRVTFWGVSDADSWLNRGRVNHPLLWDRQRQPKPAFGEVMRVLASTR
jgi:endo-1,4-beta-xylanase